MGATAGLPSSAAQSGSSHRWTRRAPTEGWSMAPDASLPSRNGTESVPSGDYRFRPSKPTRQSAISRVKNRQGFLLESCKSI